MAYEATGVIMNPRSGSFAKFGANKSELVRAAEERLADAHFLLESGRWASAVAMGIYSLEIHLKVKICEKLEIIRLPTALEFHDLDELLVVTGLSERIKQEELIHENWQAIVVESTRLNELRYRPVPDSMEKRALEFFLYLDDSQVGVLPWLSRSK